MVINKVTDGHKTEGVKTVSENINNLSNSCENVPPCQVLSRPSLFKTLESVKAQVDYEYFGVEITARNGEKWRRVDPLIHDLCLIVAEVYITPPDRLVNIRGMKMEAAVVQEVYSALQHEHIQHVAERFKEQGHTIHRKVPYLQTMLYNVLFEYDASITNDCRNRGLITGV